MENPVNIQNTFFNQARKDRSRVTVYLTSGIKLVGRIKSFDKFTVILESNSGDQMIFKHAISTVSAARQFGNYLPLDRAKGSDARGKAAQPEKEKPAQSAGGGETPAAERT
jgi:host factor-I protein